MKALFEHPFGHEEFIALNELDIIGKDKGLLSERRHVTSTIVKLFFLQGTKQLWNQTFHFGSHCDLVCAFFFWIFFSWEILLKTPRSKAKREREQSRASSSSDKENFGALVPFLSRDLFVSVCVCDLSHCTKKPRPFRTKRWDSFKLLLQQLQAFCYWAS